MRTRKRDAHKRERDVHTNARELEEVRRRQVRVLAKLQVMQTVVGEAIDDLEDIEDDEERLAGGDDSAP